MTRKEREISVRVNMDRGGLSRDFFFDNMSVEQAVAQALADEPGANVNYASVCVKELWEPTDPTKPDYDVVG